MTDALTRTAEAPNPHILTIEDDGNWRCSCSQWGSQNLGSIHDEYCRKHGITEDTVRSWHASHANAVVISVGPTTSETGNA